MFNLLGSHDTARILTECEEDIERDKQCFTFLLTYIGQPCIYYGDEIGMKGENDPYCRGCMKWKKDDWNMEIYSHIKNLLKIRNSFKEFTESGLLYMKIIYININSFGFSRYYNNYISIILFNTSDEEYFKYYN